MNTYNKFKLGLSKYGLEPEDLNNYIEDKDVILTEDNVCVCGHTILHIKRLKHKKTIQIQDNDKHKKIIDLYIGSCCIKKFMPKGTLGKHCIRCDKIHKNRITNKCNDCKNLFEKSITDKPMPAIQPNKCLSCQKPCSTYKQCYKCYKVKSINI